MPGRDKRSRKRVRVRSDFAELPHDELARLVLTLEEEMREASAELRFEYAARLRDEISDLKGELRDVALAAPKSSPSEPRGYTGRTRVRS
jgi:excinuclease ABC subunit B